MASAASNWRPDWTVAPGEILAEEIESRGLSQSELARRMDRPTKTINEIIHGKTALTEDTALQLELALGISASFWSGLEANYRRQLARNKAMAEFAGYLDWAKQFPVRDLKRHKVIDPDVEGGAMVAALLRFFGVSSVNAWAKQWDAPQAAFRRSKAFSSSPHAIAAWLRWGEIDARKTFTEPFDARLLRNILKEARPMTREEPFSDVLGELGRQLAECGVVLVLTPELQESRVSGAARWIDPMTALIQLSLRHKSDDHFWFSLYHEAAHLLEDRRVEFIDIDDEKAEKGLAEERADQVARDLLIEPGAYAEFVRQGRLDAPAVRGFAKRECISPGVVVGRLQRDGFVPPNRLNSLKKRLNWA